MITYRPIFTLMLCLLSLSVHSQSTDWTPMKRTEIELWSTKIKAQFEGKVRMKYLLKSYKDHYTTVIEDVELGESRSDGTNSWSRIMNTETYRNGLLSATIDHSNKTVVLSDQMQPQATNLSQLWMQFLSRDCKVYQRNQNGSVIIRIEYPKGAEAVATEFTLTPEGQLIRSVVFLSVSIEENPGNPGTPSHTPRIELEITEFRRDATFEGTSLLISEVVVVNPERSVLKKKYSGYRLLDTRIHS